MNISEEEKLEIKQMLVSATNNLIEQLRDNAAEISKSDGITEDTDTCYFDMKAYKHVTSLCFHLYNPDFTSYSKKNFWRNGTYTRDLIWAILEEFLSPELYKKVQDYLTTN